MIMTSQLHHNTDRYSPQHSKSFFKIPKQIFWPCNKEVNYKEGTQNNQLTEGSGNSIAPCTMESNTSFNCEDPIVMGSHDLGIRSCDLTLTGDDLYCIVVH